MRTEQECEPYERYLYSDEILCETAINGLKLEIKKRYENRKKDHCYEKFLKWEKKENEILIFTYYSYADIKIPKKMNCLFNHKNPNEFVECSMKITQSIYEGFYPIDSIEHGHKHFFVLEFINKIPKIINEIYKSTNIMQEPTGSNYQIAICNLEDFEYIKRDIQNQQQLKEKIRK